MDKLIVNSPTFNKEAIKPDMFIVSREKTNERVMRGIIVKVEDTKIHYMTTAAEGSIRTVSLDAVLNGRAIINVGQTIATNETENAVTAIIKHASTGVSSGYNALYIKTQYNNNEVAGRTFTDVFVDGVKYTRPVVPLQFNPYITTTSISNAIKGENN